MTWQRVLTALVLIPVVVAIVLFTPTWAVAIATAVITVLALWEYFALGDAIGHRAYRLWTIFCSLLLIYTQWRTSRLDSSMFEPFHEQRSNPLWYLSSIQFSPLTVFFVFLLGLASLLLWARRPLVETLPAVGISSSALLLITFPLSFAVRVHAIPTDGRLLLLFTLIIIWVSDTVAYFVGRAIGKHALAPKISPKKTWEGAVAGMAGSLLVAWAFQPGAIPHLHGVGPVGFFESFPHRLFIMAALGNMAGQLGDLLESACKRSAGVKDSGGLLPGHGGILDRIDALILCIPVIWYYLVLVNPRL